MFEEPKKTSGKLNFLLRPDCSLLPLAAGINFFSIPLFVLPTVTTFGLWGAGMGLATWAGFRLSFSRENLTDLMSCMGAVVSALGITGLGTTGYVATQAFIMSVSDQLQDAASENFGRDYAKAKDEKIIRTTIRLSQDVSFDLIATAHDPVQSLYNTSDRHGPYGNVMKQICVYFDAISAPSRPGVYQRTLKVCQSRDLTQAEINRITPAP